VRSVTLLRNILRRATRCAGVLLRRRQITPKFQPKAARSEPSHRHFVCYGSPAMKTTIHTEPIEVTATNATATVADARPSGRPQLRVRTDLRAGKHPAKVTVPDLK